MFLYGVLGGITTGAKIISVAQLLSIKELNIRTVFKRFINFSLVVCFMSNDCGELGLLI